MFGVSALARKVQTSGQWLVVTNIYAKALHFAFPNRDHEFQTYVSQILNLFTVKYETAHEKVIAYDKAVKTRVGGGTKMLLTNQQEFVDLRNLTLNIDRINYRIRKSFGSGLSQTAPHLSTRGSMCRWWNSAKGCSFDSGTCYWSHLCQHCSRLHLGFECPEICKN